MANEHQFDYNNTRSTLIFCQLIEYHSSPAAIIYLLYGQFTALQYWQKLIFARKNDISQTQSLLIIRVQNSLFVIDIYFIVNYTLHNLLGQVMGVQEYHACDNPTRFCFYKK